MHICLERGADYLHMDQLMALHPRTLSSLASFKSRLVLPFWYWLTQAVLEIRPLNRCRCRVVVVVVLVVVVCLVHYAIVLKLVNHPTGNRGIAYGLQYSCIKDIEGILVAQRIAMVDKFQVGQTSCVLDSVLSILCV